jgi:hypothetical protein
MDTLSVAQLSERLVVFHADLGEIPPDARCPESLARVFNQLLKEAKRETGEDPIVRSIRVVDDERAAIGAVRALAGQLLAAVGNHNHTNGDSAHVAVRHAPDTAPAAIR